VSARSSGVLRASRSSRVALVLRTAAVGLAAGLVWGLVARGFMRLLATTPEFTWAGTIYVVGTASVVGGLVALVRLARQSGWTRWSRLLGLPFVLLFAAAGGLFLPGVAGVVMLLDRRRWLRVPGAGLVGLTLWAVVVQDLGGSLTVRQWTGVLVMLACLAVEGWAARELVRRWRPGTVTASPDVADGPEDAARARATVPADGEAGRSRTVAP
jgi:hypothetical protein